MACYSTKVHHKQLTLTLVIIYYLDNPKQSLFILLCLGSTVLDNYKRHFYSALSNWLTGCRKCFIMGDPWSKLKVLSSLQKKAYFSYKKWVFSLFFYYTCVIDNLHILWATPNLDFGYWIMCVDYTHGFSLENP